MVRGALLLAAGLGTRLRPLTDVLPKCLAPIRGRPLLEYWLRSLAEAGVERIVVNTHYHFHLVEEYVQSGPWTDRVTLVHEPTLLGTGGTMLANRELLRHSPFLVAHADNLSLFSLRDFVIAHSARPKRTALTMMTFTTDSPQTCGIVTTDQRGVVDGFYEKVAHPPGDRANAAVYLMEHEVIEYAASLGRPILDISTDVLPHFVGRMCTWHNTVYHRDIGNLASWRAAQRDFPDNGAEMPAPDPWKLVLEALTRDARDKLADFLVQP
jgi:mannose-1-phosphate guanylyltransferase